MLDLTSFGLGFAVAPVAYLLFGALVYGVFSTAKWLVRPEASSHPICRTLASELASDKLY